MVGYSGCGKTTYAKTLAFKKNADIFCADEILFENHKKGLTYRENIQNIEKIKFDMLVSAFLSSKNIILDGNFLSFFSRKVVMNIIRFIAEDPKIKRMAHIRRKEVCQNYNVTVIHIDNEWDECTVHRAERDGCDWKTHKDLYDHKDIPLMSEGFYAIKTIHNDYTNTN